MEITQKTFCNLSQDNKLKAIYDYVKSIDIRTSNIEKRKKRDSIISNINGIVGGFIAVIALTFLKILNF
jgi:hypothetical protein